VKSSPPCATPGLGDARGLLGAAELGHVGARPDDPDGPARGVALHRTAGEDGPPAAVRLAHPQHEVERASALAPEGPPLGLGGALVLRVDVGQRLLEREVRDLVGVAEHRAPAAVHADPRRGDVELPHADARGLDDAAEEVRPLGETVLDASPLRARGRQGERGHVRREEEQVEPEQVGELRRRVHPLKARGPDADEERRRGGVGGSETERGPDEQRERRVPEVGHLAAEEPRLAEREERHGDEADDEEGASGRPALRGGAGVRGARRREPRQEDRGHDDRAEERRDEPGQCDLRRRRRLRRDAVGEEVDRSRRRRRGERRGGGDAQREREDVPDAAQIAGRRHPSCVEGRGDGPERGAGERASHGVRRRGAPEERQNGVERARGGEEHAARPSRGGDGARREEPRRGPERGHRGNAVAEDPAEGVRPGVRREEPREAGDGPSFRLSQVHGRGAGPGCPERRGPESPVSSSDGGPPAP